MTNTKANCANPEMEHTQAQISLLKDLIHESIHALSEFNFPRLEQLTLEQEVALQAISVARSKSGILAQRNCEIAATQVVDDSTRPEESLYKHGLIGTAIELRNAALVYSKVLANTSRTVAALSSGRHVIAANSQQSA